MLPVPAAWITARRGYWLVLLAAAGYFLTWWNGYVPPTGGGEAVAMTSWGREMLPYRDYFFQAPPGMPMVLQAVQWLGGPHLLATLTFGACLRVVAVGALYLLLLDVCRPQTAVVATLTAFVVSCSDISDTPFYYNHVSASLVLIGTYLAVLSGKHASPTSSVAGVCAGAFIAFSVCVKQTMVFGAAGAVVAAALLAAPWRKRGLATWLLAIGVGAALAAAGTLAWLSQFGLMAAFREAMAAAPQGKGGVFRSLLRPVTLLDTIPDAYIASIGAWVLIALAAALIVSAQRKRALPHVVVLGVGVVFMTFFLWIATASHGRTLTLFFTALGWWGGLALAGLALLVWRDRPRRAIAALGVLSFTVGYSFTVSWPLFENAALPGLALVLAVAIDHAPASSSRKWLAAAGVLVVVAVGTSVYRKFTFPHSWGYWIEPPIYAETGRIEDDAFRGVRVSKTSSDLYDIVRSIAEERTAPDDRMYVFPNMPVLYAIANRRPATYALTHWVDTSPDAVARADAQRLREGPPAILVIRDDPFRLIEIEEYLYRGGEKSGVRDVFRALDDIKPLYDTVAIYRSMASRPIAVLVRRDHDPPDQ